MRRALKATRMLMPASGSRIRGKGSMHTLPAEFADYSIDSRREVSTYFLGETDSPGSTASLSFRHLDQACPF